MKRQVLILLTGLILSLSAAWGQQIPDGVAVAFRKGDSQGLDKYLGSEVNLVIQGRSTDAGRQKAKETMAVFFRENKVQGFAINHEGQRDESSFIIGTLKTGNGNFRVHCFFKKVQNEYVIHQIRIEKVNE